MGKNSLLSGVKRFFGGSTAEDVNKEVEADVNVNMLDSFSTPIYFSGLDSLIARDSQYDEYFDIESDGLVSSALSLTLTAALGGHESNGDVVFIEAKPNITEEQRKILDDLNLTVSKIVNKIVYSVGYIGITYGDAFARVHSKPGVGVQSAVVDSMTHPKNIVAYERGGKTVGFYVRSIAKLVKKDRPPVLNTTQMARFKMPRISLSGTNDSQSIARAEQDKDRLFEDDANEVKIYPSSIGGSLITQGVARAYKKYSMALVSMTTQRMNDSIDEAFFTVQQSGDVVRDDRLSSSIKKMFTRSRQLSEYVRSGTEEEQMSALLMKHRHFLPIGSDGKQSVLDSGISGTKRSGAPIGIEDVMVLARLTVSPFGVDLSSLGFADQMSGGLGEGGFFRTSAQLAERARMIRPAIADFVEQLIDIHLLSKYDLFFADIDRFWTINFFGSISALESERRDTMNAAMTSGATIVQTIQMMKDAGFTSDSMKLFLTKQMMIDEDLAASYVEFDKSKEEGA